MTDDRTAFEEERWRHATEMRADRDLADRARDLFILSDRHDYSYQWNWLGLPIIQIPQDVVAMQELIWSTRPTVIIETGVARGGSTIFHASMLQLIGEGQVVAIDVDIRPHNRAAIESHPMAHRITLLEGSSTDPTVVNQVRERIRPDDRVMIVLDSDHTHQHVLAELRQYAPLVSVGQYLVVADTIVELMPAQDHRPRRWGPGDNPMTALEEFLSTTDNFEVDDHIDAKILLTSTPHGYLRRVR